MYIYIYIYIYIRAGADIVSFVLCVSPHDIVVPDV